MKYVVLAVAVIIAVIAGWKFVENRQIAARDAQDLQDMVAAEKRAQEELIGDLERKLERARAEREGRFEIPTPAPPLPEPLTIRKTRIYRVKLLCGPPDATTTHETADAQSVVLTYKANEGHPYECVGTLTFKDGALESITR